MVHIILTHTNEDMTLTAIFHVHEHTPGAWESAGDKLVQKCTKCGTVLAEKVPLKVKSVSIIDLTLNYKSTAMLQQQITADEGAQYTVKYESGNPNVVKVNEKTGEVTGVKRGSATITCTVTDEFANTITDTCNVTVRYTVLQWMSILMCLHFLFSGGKHWPFS